MKLYLSNKYHIKTMPHKFSAVRNIEFYIEDEHHKRLTKNERENLKQALFGQVVEDLFLSVLREKEPLVMERITDRKPIAAFKVLTNDNQKYYVLKFDNKMAVRCNSTIFNRAPTKTILRYANGLGGNKIPPPGEEQLQLF